MRREGPQGGGGVVVGGGGVVVLRWGGAVGGAAKGGAQNGVSAIDKSESAHLVYHGHNKKCSNNNKKHKGKSIQLEEYVKFG